MDRFNRDGDNARDDDGNRLLLSKVDQVEVDDVEVAHIIPYSLASQNAKEKRDIEVCVPVPYDSYTKSPGT